MGTHNKHGAHWDPQTVLEDDIPWLREASIEKSLQDSSETLCGSHSGACNCEETSLLSKYDNQTKIKCRIYIYICIYLIVFGYFPPGNCWNLCLFKYHAHGDVHNSLEIHECLNKCEHIQIKHLTFKGPCHNPTNILLSSKKSAAFLPKFKTCRPVTEGQQKQLSKGKG